MQTHTLYSLLTVGFGLGLLHALDADHVMAVSALATNKRKPRSTRTVLKFCTRWALGHGGVLLALTAVLIFAGMTLPPIVADIATKAIGVMLVAIGLFILWSVYTQRLRLAVHTHDDITHLHIAHDDTSAHDHTPTLIGVTHGLAGSAPVLAIIPAIGVGEQSAWFALTYVALFSLGVILAMLTFGLALARVQHWLAKAGRRVFNIGRLIVGISSIACGTYWFFVAH